MKNLLLITAILFSIAAISQNDAYANRMQHIFDSIDQSKVYTGFLKDYGLRFANMELCDGVLTESNYVNPAEWQSLYTSLYSMRVGNVAASMLSPQTVSTNLKAAQSNNEEHVPIAVQSYNYQQYKSSALTNGDVTVIDEKIYDVIGRNPYDTKILFAALPIKQHFQGSSISFILPSNLVFSNVSSNVSQVQVDFGNDEGYQTLYMDDPFYVNYNSTGIKNIKVKFTYQNGLTVQSHSKISIDFIETTLPKSFDGSNLLWNEVAIIGTPYNGANAVGNVTIELALGHTQLTKPLIIIEGFDPENTFNYRNLINGGGAGGLFVGVGGGISLNEAIEDEGYDLVFVDFRNSTDFIQRNAFMVEEVIRRVNILKAGGEPNVVLGLSMGGLVGRYALRHMELNGETHDTELYISHDTPHQGANVPLAVQGLLRHIVGEEVSLPVFFEPF